MGTKPYLAVLRAQILTHSSVSEADVYLISMELSSSKAHTRNVPAIDSIFLAISSAANPFPR